MNNSSKLIKLHPRTNIDAYYDSMDDIGEALYDFMQPYNMFEITNKLDDYTGEDLCIGRVGFGQTDVRIRRDFFHHYPSLVHNQLCEYMIESVEILSDKKAKINRKDGIILIEGSLDEELSKHENTIKKVPYLPIEYTVNDFIDVSLSRKVNGEFYYVLDLYRLRNHDKSLIKFLRINLKIDDYFNTTKTLYFKFTEPEKGSESPREIGIWDIINSCPVNGFKK